jgi:hypothetical protein
MEPVYRWNFTQSQTYSRCSTKEGKMKTAALLLVLSVAASPCLAKPTACQKDGGDNPSPAPAWAVEIEQREHGGTDAGTVVDPRSSVWWRATCDEKKKTVKWCFSSYEDDSTIVCETIR